MLRGSSGIPSLVLTLKVLLTADISHLEGGDPNTIDDVLEAMGWLSHYGWVEDIANPAIVSMVLNVLR